MKTELDDWMSRLDTMTEEMKEKFEMDRGNIRSEFWMQGGLGKKMHFDKWLVDLPAVPPSDIDSGISGRSTQTDDPDDIIEPIMENIPVVGVSPVGIQVTTPCLSSYKTQTVFVSSIDH